MVGNDVDLSEEEDVIVGDPISFDDHDGPSIIEPQEAVEISDENTELASKPGKNILILGLLGVAAIIFLYVTVFEETEEEKKKEEIQEVIESQPIENATSATQQDTNIPSDIGLVDVPDLPDVEDAIPEIEDNNQINDFDLSAPVIDDQVPFSVPEIPQYQPPPVQVVEEEKVETPVVGDVQPVITPPAPAPVQPVIAPLNPQQPVIIGPTAEEIAARRSALRKESMIVMSGGKGEPDDEGGESGDDSRLVGGKKRTSGANSVEATNVGNLDFLILEGKIIEAVLETAINTDLKGSLRAIISRDVYSESGANVLISRGSRLIGTYDAGVKKGQTRVEISWTRVIRPDGVDIEISSPATDQLGRTGAAGYVDNKYFEIFSNSLLISAVSIGSTIIFDKIKPSSDTTTTSTTSATGTTNSTTGNPTDLAVTSSVGDLSEISRKVSQDLADSTQPTITINQGTRINVYISKDLIFSEDSLQDSIFIK
ncbi:hypothetical protein N9W34_02090 [Rickettsiales bacterium]|nr:hypothetical protein [Rickettsiales bacterium]